MVQTKSGDIVLDCQIKRCNGWVAGVKFLCETGPKRAQVAQSMAKPLEKDINILHAELGHPLEVITEANGRAMIFI